MNKVKNYKPSVFVIDFGSQTTQLILRRIREIGVYCEVISYKDLDKILKKPPKALIFSGGPSSAFLKNAPRVNKGIYKLGIPILGICYGMQIICEQLNGQVKITKKREFGKARIKLLMNNKLFSGILKVKSYSQVWMSHGDEVTKIPKGFDVLASTDSLKVAAIGNVKKNIYGLQFHPEVIHTLKGKNILENFIFKIAKIKIDWKIKDFLDIQLNKIRNTVRDEKVVCGLSGGVDSSVAAALISKAIGKNLICIFVNHGLLRKNEEKEVITNFKKYTKAKLVYINAKNEFLLKLKGVKEPEKKRKIIGRHFIKIFEREAKKIRGAKFLAQGTLYPDVIESKKIDGSKSKIIKSHHNVGGLPKKLNLELLEPLRELFKDEVRDLGKELGLPMNIIKRHPFPGPGLAIRIPGDVTNKKINILKQVDAIYLEELKKNNLYDKIWQAFCVLLPVKSVGVMGDSRSYELTISLRAITSKDGMTAEVFFFNDKFLKLITGRIIGEVIGVNRVLYDVTSKPPATIEWE